MLGYRKSFETRGVQSNISYFAIWDISVSSYDNKSFSVATQDAQPDAIYFNTTGTSMYIIGVTNARIYQYTLSTAWDISTASYANKSFLISTQASNPTGLSFDTTGTKMYIVDNGSDKFYQYTLSTAWDISTASYANKSLSTLSSTEFPLDLHISPNGTQLYIVGSNANYDRCVWEYNIATAWDISTASYTGRNYIVSQEIAATSVYFNSSGLQMFVVGSYTDTIYQYTLSTAWDISTASYANKSRSISAQEDISSGIFVNSAGTKIYLVGTSSDKVYQYTLS